jgi:hypothetical protein
MNPQSIPESAIHGNSGGLGIFLVLLLIGIYLWSLSWLYSDAERRNNSGCLMVILVGIFAWPIGLVVWYFARPSPKRTNPIQLDSEIDCPKCGYRLSQGMLLCPNCGTSRNESAE